MQSGKQNIYKEERMKRLFLVLLFSFTLLNAGEMGLKGGGCSLAQEGEVQLQLGNKVYSNISYSGAAKSGANFREIFVGSQLKVRGTTLKILDYKPNKRMKGKPKTGLFMVEVKTASTTSNITMTYIFDAGMLSATGIYNKSSIGFVSKVKYSLCHVTIKK